jgi:cell wall-associated NlpC family hydrolase
MTTQLLFGDMLEILEEKGKEWALVRCAWDNVVGWVRKGQVLAITPSEFAEYNRSHAFALDLVQSVLSKDHLIPIFLGSQLPLFDGIRLHLGEEEYTYSGQAVSTGDIPDPVQFILRVSRRYLEAPYLPGGRSPFGIDASGLVQTVYKMVGFRLPRLASDQVFCGNPVDFAENARPGDLAFFENRAGKIDHAGILLPDNQVLHVQEKARIDRIDHYGVFDTNSGKYTRRLRVIKRLLSADQVEELDSVMPKVDFSASQPELF